MFVPLKITPAGAESTLKKYGTLLNLFRPDVKRLQQKLEQINFKRSRNEVSIIFDQTCLKEKMLPIYIYIYICVCVCVCVYVCVCIYIYIYIFLSEIKLILQWSTVIRSWTICFWIIQIDLYNKLVALFKILQHYLPGVCLQNITNQFDIWFNYESSKIQFCCSNQ